MQGVKAQEARGAAPLCRSRGTYEALGISWETLALPKVPRFRESSAIQTSSPRKPISSKRGRSGFYLRGIQQTKSDLSPIEEGRRGWQGQSLHPAHPRGCWSLFQRLRAAARTPPNYHQRHNDIPKPILGHMKLLLGSKFKLDNKRKKKRGTLFHTEHNYTVQFITTRCCGSQE